MQIVSVKAMKESASSRGRAVVPASSSPGVQAVLPVPCLPCYQQAINVTKASGEEIATRLHIEQSGLAIRVSEEMGRSTGRVYLPQALPVGLDERLIN